MRNRTLYRRDGGVLQAGLDFKERPTSGLLRPSGGPLRAIVINTYVSSDIDNLRSYRVECDVIIVRTGLTVKRAIVAQANHGVNNLHGLWVPKPCTRNIVTSEPMSFRGMAASGAPATPATPYSDLDGDHVLVEFIESDVDKPVITRALPHSRTKRIIVGANGDPVQSSGWDETNASTTRGVPARDEYYLAHQGSEIRVNAHGDVLVDTVGATDDAATEAPSTSHGQVRVRVKSSQRFTVEMDGVDVLEVFKQGAQVRIDLGEGATERVVLGDAFMSLFNSHQHPTSMGPSGTPIQQMTAAQHLSNLAKVKQ